MMVSDETWTLLVASYLPSIGKNTLCKIALDPAFYKATFAELPDIHPALIEFVRRTPKFDLAVKRANAQIQQAEALGVKIVGAGDPNYPRTFRRAANAPAIFWYRGDDEALKSPQVAVIGTRRPTSTGLVIAQRISAALSGAGICVVSGLALGIDTAAHEACVELNRRAIAVLPAGLDNIAPRSNALLAEKIVRAGGGLLSEFPLGMPPLPANFVTRDLTQAALSVSVVLIQSDKTGGSMHASRAAIKLRRQLVVAMPTKADIAKNEPKINANLAFVRGSVVVDKEMEFPIDTMQFVRILHGREDYPNWVQEIRTTWADMKPTLAGTSDAITT